MMDGDTDKIGTVPKGSGGVPTAELGLDKPSPPMEVEEDEVIPDQDDPGQLVVMGTTENGAGEELEQVVPLTGAELEAKVRELEAIVEEQRKSLDDAEKENGDLKETLGKQATALGKMKEQTKKLKNRLKTTKQMFKNEWDNRKRQWEWKEEELLELRKEEQLMLEKVRNLEKAVGLTSKEAWLKLEQIRVLTEKVEELKNEKGKRVKVKPVKKRTSVKNNGRVKKVPGNFVGGRKCAEEILPEEVWKIILGKVSDPKDLWNLCNTCQLFDNILSKWKTGWMLAEALPYIYKDLPGGKLLECRLVCKSWKGMLDSFLETHPSIVPHNADKINPRRLDYVNPMKQNCLMSTGFTFCNADDPSILEDPVVAKIPGTNPFVGGWVCLSLGEYKPREGSEDEDTITLIEKVCHFLTSFGNEIWYLSIWLPQQDELHPRIVQFLVVDLLPLVPCLKGLTMECPSSAWHPVPVPGPESLPSAPNLETLQAYCHLTELHDPLIALLMQRYCAQLQKLFSSAAATSFFELCTLEWPNLRELHLIAIGAISLLEGLNGSRMPQLSKLGLNLEAIGDYSSYENLLVIIRQLSSTTRLTTIRFEGGLQLLKMGPDQFSWNHCAPPSIKTLEVDGNWGWNVREDEAQTPPNYAFLLQYFPFVENVHVYWRNSYHLLESEIDLLPQEECFKLALKHGFQEASEIVEVNKYAYRGQMYRSNIWELLPRLKVFSFQWDVYTRHGYEEYQEKAKKWVNNAN